MVGRFFKEGLSFREVLVWKFCFLTKFDANFYKVKLSYDKAIAKTIIDKSDMLHSVEYVVKYKYKLHTLAANI